MQGKKKITNKERKNQLIKQSVFTFIACGWFSARVGNAMLSVGEDATLIDGVLEMSEHWEDFWKIFPTTSAPFVWGLLTALLIWAFLLTDYQRRKDTVDDAHGGAAFEEDMDEYYREFVYDPSVVYEDKDKRQKKTYQLQDRFKEEDFKRVLKGNIKNKNVLSKEMREACLDMTQIYSDTVFLSLSGKWTQRNTNALVFGASGAGKSRFFLLPNLLQANSSYIITDPSGDIMQKGGYFLTQKGYIIKSFNLKDMSKSCRFNPLWYIHDNSDIDIIAATFQQNANQTKKSSGGDPFWDKAALLLLTACIGYLYEVCPLEQRTFSNVRNLLNLDTIDENASKNEDNDFDKMFKALGEANPDSYAYQQYVAYRQAPAKTALSIVTTLNADLRQVSNSPVKNLMYKDEMELDQLGQQKMAIFLNIPQEDTTYAWISAMLYCLTFRELYRQGEQRMHDEGLSDPELKVPVRALIDECKNVGRIPNIENILATCRKYRLSVVPIFQNYSQVEGLYGKDLAMEFLANCDTMVFLGGSDSATLKIVCEHLGKETVHYLSDSYSPSGKKIGMTSSSKQATGKDLMSQVEVEQMSNSQCLVFIRALKPFKCPKYRLENHKNYKYLAEGKEGRPYVDQFYCEYDDEAIESIRLRTPDEEGYVEPQVVDSARRRTLIETNRKKASKLREDIKACQKEFEEFKAKYPNPDPKICGQYEKTLATMKNQLIDLEKTDPELKEKREQEEQKQKMEECDETQTKRTKKEEPKILTSDDEIDIDIESLMIIGSYAPAYEFEPSDFAFKPVGEDTTEDTATDDRPLDMDIHTDEGQSKNATEKEQTESIDPSDPFPEQSEDNEDLDDSFPEDQSPQTEQTSEASTGASIEDFSDGWESVV